MDAFDLEVVAMLSRRDIHAHLADLKRALSEGATPAERHELAFALDTAMLTVESRMNLGVVDECIGKFLSSELAPEDAATVSGPHGAASRPRLGAIARRGLGRLGPSDRARVRDVLARLMLSAYVGCALVAGGQDRVGPGVDPGELYRAWRARVYAYSDHDLGEEYWVAMAGSEEQKLVTRRVLSELGACGDEGSDRIDTVLRHFLVAGWLLRLAEVQASSGSDRIESQATTEPVQPGIIGTLRAQPEEPTPAGSVEASDPWSDATHPEPPVEERASNPDHPDPLPIVIPGDSGTPRGSWFQDGCLGCLGYVLFQPLAGLALAALALMAHRQAVVQTESARAGETLLGVVGGIGGFFLAFAVSARVRRRGGPFRLQVAPVIAGGTLLLLFLCALGIGPRVGGILHPPPALLTTNLSVVSLLTIDGERVAWDDYAWEGGVTLRTADGRVTQVVTWRHQSALTPARVEEMVRLTTGGSAKSTEGADRVELDGVRTHGYRWASTSPEGEAVTTSWDCPETSLNIAVTTASEVGTSRDILRRLHERTVQSAVCLTAAATASAPDNLHFLGGQGWVEEAVDSGGSRRWTNARKGSLVTLYTRRASKFRPLIAGEQQCLSTLRLVAQSALGDARELPNATATYTASGCATWLATPESQDIPSTKSYWEIRDCQDGDVMVAGYISTGSPDPEPEKLWACGSL